MSVRALSLDMLGTLVRLEDPVPRLRAGLVERTGVDPGPEAAARGFTAEIGYYLAHHMEGRDAESVEALRDRCAAELHAALGVPGLDRAAVRGAMMSSLVFTAFEDVLPALRELRARGLKLVVTSNWDASLPNWVAGSGLADLVDATVSSAVVGKPKPAPEVFLAAVASIGLRPEDALHVGDSFENDVQGARAAGLRAALIVREGVPPAAVDAVASLGEVASLL